MDTNIFLIIILITIFSVLGYCFYVFLKMPSNAQIAKIKEWLLYAVAKAEKELGSGTGQLKLRYVYDMFITKFSHLSKIISFEAFSLLVDESLDIFREMLENNKNISNYIEKE